MIQKISNPGQSSTNAVVVINNTACCSSDCPDCAYVVDGIITSELISEPAIYIFLNAAGAEVSITLTTADIETIRNELLIFINSIGYYGTLDDIRITDYIDGDDNSVYKIEVIGCANFISVTTINEAILSETLCVFVPSCDYTFTTEGSEDPVPVSLNGTESTVAAFSPADPQAVPDILAVFFTTATSIDVTINDAETELTIVLHGYLPNDLIYIDGQQGIKGPCRKVYIA